MLIDMTPVSHWYALHHNFKIVPECSACQGKNIIYFKVRAIGAKGVAPECADCGKKFPIRSKALALNHKAPLKRDFTVNN